MNGLRRHETFIGRCLVVIGILSLKDYVFHRYGLGKQEPSYLSSLRLSVPIGSVLEANGKF